jgi:hypothetical protein
MSRRSSTKPDPRSGAAVKPVAGPVLQRKCACGNQAGGGGDCAECQKKNHELQRKVAEPETTSAHHDAIPPIVNEVLDSSGQPLDAATRSFMEPRFGHDFSGVRVHTDAHAAESAQAVNAQAYTAGKDVVFAPGQYQPGTEAGHAVLAHELSHVVQQDGVSGHAAKTMSHPSDSSEREADNIAGRVLRSEPVSVNQSPGSAIQALSVGEGIGRGVSGVIAGGVIGLGIAALAGAFDKEDFTKTELDEYLKSLKDNKKKEGNRDSDNKARDVVRKKLFKGLDLDLRILLIDEMLTGSAGDDDEDAILVIIGDATPKERQTIAERIGYARLYHKFDGDQLDALYALYPEMGSLHPRGGEKRETRSIHEFIDRWEQQHGATMTPEEKATLGRGCVGITALNMEDLNNPDLSNCYNSFAEVWTASKTMTSFLEQNFPDKKAYIFSKRFWSHGVEFPADPSGKVDLSAHSGDPRPSIGNWHPVNFDYGLYDDKTGNWWHANHCDPILSESQDCKDAYRPSDRMQVYESNLQSYSKPLRDFDTQVFCVAVGKK